ncbi:hypothetical protein LIER_15404 [Lithospermum erythrorhizon]|uniref:WD repeat-containing protein 53 n=1 Tax=Lithospermum erythrorhizon TaxID=34254 RepID=A0AAV3Q3P9_LITER
MTVINLTATGYHSYDNKYVLIFSGNEDVIYVSTGNEVKSFDVHMADSWKPLESYNYNKDEINQIGCNSKASFLAAADDSGDVKIIDIQQNRLYKSLRAGHATVKICSTVRFLPWRSWEVITGGLDSKLVMWDFSKGRPQKIVDFGVPDVGSQGNVGQCLNPAFVHALAVPEVDVVERVGKVCVVARGDGVVDVIDIESEVALLKSKSSLKSKKVGSIPKSSVTAADSQAIDQKKRKLHLDYSVGGHTAAVSCVEFSMFGEKGNFIISGGNDKQVKVWNWLTSLDADETARDSDLLRLSLNLSKKVNWLCTTPTDTDNLVICDTSKIVKLYTVA